MAKFIKVSELKFNPDNPRIINEAKLEKLKKSLTEFPQMMRLRPIICSSKDDKTVLGGNMRLKSLIDLGYEEIPNEWVLFADELTDKQKKEFIIKDNVSFGDWDLDALSIDWDSDLLEDWGLDLINSDIQVLDDDNSNLDNNNYGNTSSKNTVPFTVLSIGGLLRREIAEQLVVYLVSKGCDADDDNGVLLEEIILEWLEG